MKIWNLVRYQIQVYFKGSNFVMPFVAIILFFAVMYTIKPVDVVSGYIVSGVFLFLVMCWIGMSIGLKEDVTIEEILLLRIKKVWKYYCGKVLFLVSIAFIGALLCTFLPVIQNVINDCTLFIRTLTVSDVGNAFLLQIGFSVSGIMLGSLFHPRVIKMKRIGLVLMALVAVLSVVKLSIIEEIPLFKYLLWIFPSILSPAEIYHKAEYFSYKKSIEIVVMFLIYAVVYAGIKCLICEKKKF